MLVVLFALTILGLEYGVMMEESFTLETLSLISSIFKIYYLEMEEV